MAVYYQMSYCQLLLIYMCNIHTVFQYVHYTITMCLKKFNFTQDG